MDENLADSHPELNDRVPSEYFFYSRIFRRNANLSNRYALQKGVSLKTDANEIMKFFGIHIVIGYHVLSNEDCYWSTAPDL